jgi:hypothetical protein
MSIGDDQTASGYQAEYEIWGDEFVVASSAHGRKV